MSLKSSEAALGAIKTCSRAEYILLTKKKGWEKAIGGHAVQRMKTVQLLVPAQTKRRSKRMLRVLHSPPLFGRGPL